MDTVEEIYHELIKKVYERSSLAPNDKTENSKLLMRAELFAKVGSNPDSSITDHLIELVHDIEWAARRARSVRLKRTKELFLDLEDLAEQENELMCATLVMIHHTLGDVGYEKLYDEPFSKTDIHVAFNETESESALTRFINSLNHWPETTADVISQAYDDELA